MRNLLIVGWILMPALAGAVAPTAPKLVIPKDGMVIRKDTTLKPGTYSLPKGLIIAEDNVTLDGNGAVLVGAEDGQAVLAESCTNLTVKNVKAERYTWGIRVKNGKNVTVEDCHVRQTAEETPADGVWLDIWRKPEEAYGAAIFLWNVTDGRVAGNDVQHQQNGISLYSCTGLTVEKNNASFQSGWGIHLYNSSKNTIQDNLADWCNRIHKRGERVYYPGADAAGMLVIWNSSNNVIQRNMLRGGGDGVFMAGYRAPTDIAPCNDNLFEDNDCSYSPNNAFESTFCQGNIFRNNRASFSNYGFWLGYSWDNVVEGNEVRRNRIAGIATEHGYNNTMKGNSFSNNVRGIALWSRSDAHYANRFPGTDASASNTIAENTFVANGVGVLLKRDGERESASPTDEFVWGNAFYGNNIGVLLSSTRNAVVQDNRFEKSQAAGLRVEGGTGTVAVRNTFVDQEPHAWADTPVKWTTTPLTPERKPGTGVFGNYWGTAREFPYSPDGPDPGEDTKPLLETTKNAPEGRWLITEMDMLRSTPR